jgi:hypothetical protein
VQTWTFSASSFDPYEVFQGTGPQVLNGSLTVTGGVQGVETHPDALLDFSPPANAFQASVDVISNTPGTALGFTSSSVLNNNFATSGQIWMVYKNPLGQGQPATWELHTNGTAGPSASGTIIAPGYNHLAISYDPATHRVVGSINGVPTAALSYTPIGIRYVGVEGGTNGRGTVDDFIVQAGAIAPAAPRVGKPGIAPTSDVALSTFSTTSISSDVLGSPSLGTDSLLL